MKLVDADGLDLYVGGDKTTALVYLQSLVSSEDANRISADENGKISFNTEGLNVSDDAAYELINNLVNSKNNYLFEVASETEGFERSGKDNKERGNSISLNTEKKKSGLYNLSENEKMKYSTDEDYLPKEGYNGQVTLGKGYWLTIDGKNWQPKSNIIFHELAENYYRTEFGYYYANSKDKNKAAHARANKDAERFKKQDGKAGEGQYVPYKN
jgi:hypothetical protein